MTIPTITTSRLTLRPFTLADVDPLHQILSHPNILDYFPNPGVPSKDRVQKMIEHQLNHWAEQGLGWWAVVPKDQTDLIGWNGLQYLPETDEVEVGYLLSKEFWGQGLATEGAKASLNFGFEEHKLAEIIGLTHPENTASQNVLKKCGMRYVEQKEYFGIQVFRFVLQSHQKT